MACKNNKVTFRVHANVEQKNLFLIGNCSELGAWNPEKALKLTYNEEEQCFKGSKSLPVAAEVEYKVSLSKNWDNVELGQNCEEVANHTFVVAKGHVEDLTIVNFKK